MANPVTVNCPKDTWTKVATNVTEGVVFTYNPLDTLIYATYKLTGESAPTLIGDASMGNRTGKFSISSGDSIDVYIYPVKADAIMRMSL